MSKVEVGPGYQESKDDSKALVKVSLLLRYRDVGEAGFAPLGF